MSKQNSTLTQERLREVLHYDPETGIFTWRVNRAQMVAGSVAGGPNGKGYWYIKIDRYSYPAHRLAWLYVHGVWPPFDTDHHDTKPSNNRIDNLREATRGQNRQNMRKAHKNNKAGLLGVMWHKQSQRWRAKITVDGKGIHLGNFLTPELASAAYAEAKRKYHPFATV